MLLALALHRTNRWLESGATRLEPTGDVGALPDGKALRVLSLGFERVVADLFWLRTVYYLGDDVSHRAGYPAAARLAELVTDIDPYFDSAYILMNSVLTVLRREPEAAIRLLDKGIAHLPGLWKLHFLQGFNHFMYGHDYKRAAQHMRAAAELGGPPYLPLLASRLYHRAGDPDTALAFLELRIAEAETPEVRAELEGRLRDVWIARDLAAIDAALERWRKPAAPTRVAELYDAGLLAREPRDPAGNVYVLRDGRAACDLEHDPLALHGVPERR